jgi:hypothetical protein
VSDQIPDAHPRAHALDAAEGELRYDPNHLVDHLRDLLRLDNDVALAHRLRVRPPTLSKVRRQRVAVSPALLIAMHEATGMAIAELRRLMGDRRPYFSPLILEASVTIIR